MRLRLLLAGTARGAVALSLDDLAGKYPTFAISDRWLTIRRVLEVRRAIDLLLACGDVDPARIVFAGISDGAELGGILASAGSPSLDRMECPAPGTPYGLG